MIRGALVCTLVSVYALLVQSANYVVAGGAAPIAPTATSVPAVHFSDSLQSDQPAGIVASLLATPFQSSGLPEGMANPTVAEADPRFYDLEGTVGGVIVSLESADSTLDLPLVAYLVFPDAFTATHYFDDNRRSAQAEDRLFELDTPPFEYISFMSAQNLVVATAVAGIVLVDNVIISSAVQVPLNPSDDVAAAKIGDAVTLANLAIDHLEVLSPAALSTIDTSRTQRLFEQIPSTSDNFGRVPLSRPTFAPGAELAAGLLSGPLVAIVEAGSFDVTIDGSTVSVGPGDTFAVKDGETLSAANIGVDWGAWLILLQGRAEREDSGYATMPGTFPYSLVCAEREGCLPEGITHWLLFPQQSLVQRLAPATFTLDRIELAHGSEIDSLDLGGDSGTVAVYFYVEFGAIDGVTSGTHYEAGQKGQFDAAAIEGVRAVGPRGASMLVLRWGEEQP